VSSLEKELEALKSEYSEMLYNTYKHYKLNDYITFLFAAKDFNDIYRRIYYVKQYTQMREMKAAEIDSVTVKLNADIDSLNVEKQKLDKLKNQRNKELKSLSADEAKQKKIVSDLKSTSKRLSNKIRQKEKEIQGLQRSIQRLVSNEARKGQKTERSAEFYALTGRFDQNKGKLPYPIEGGVIVDRYGQH
jgi:septal ring factor EnvC (AmiA/AmiB activator)